MKLTNNAQAVLNVMSETENDSGHSVQYLSSVLEDLSLLNIEDAIFELRVYNVVERINGDSYRLVGGEK